MQMYFNCNNDANILGIIVKLILSIAWCVDKKGGEVLEEAGCWLLVAG
jgi:hypothetical protein